VDETRVTVIRYPVASQPIDSRTVPKRPTFLFAGRLSPEKGVETLLSATATIRGNLLVRIIGRGPLEEALRRRVTAERLPVEIAPFIDDPEELRQEIRSATAMVVPSVSYENAPMAVLEAAAVGVPSIASRIGGIPEIVSDGVTGILVRPGDPASLARALEMVAADASCAASLGDRAWRRVRVEHDPSRHVASVVSCYTDVLARRMPGPLLLERPSSETYEDVRVGGW
jgi:glycosyltransferase involved in cell wall biosynthesis